MEKVLNFPDHRRDLKMILINSRVCKNIAILHFHLFFLKKNLYNFVFTVLLCSRSHTLVWCPDATVGAIIHQYQSEFRYHLSP